MSYSSFSSGYGQNPGIMGKPWEVVLAGAQSGASGMMAKFRNNKMVSGGTDFLYSNSLVAKVCFLVLIIILFIIAVRLGSRLIWFGFYRLLKIQYSLMVLRKGTDPFKNTNKIHQILSQFQY